MKVHIFGAASSPGCANYGLKHLAAEGEGSFNEDTIKFIKINFYVDSSSTKHVNSAAWANFGCTSSFPTAPKS